MAVARLLGDINGRNYLVGTGLVVYNDRLAPGRSQLDCQSTSNDVARPSSAITDDDANLLGRPALG